MTSPTSNKIHIYLFKRKTIKLCVGDLNQELFSVDNVDLMDRNGKLMNLTERAQSTDLVTSVLKERETYIPVRVSREFSCSLEATRN